MSMLDKLKSMMKGHEDVSREGLGKAGDAVNEKTEGKYSSQVDTAQQKINEQLGNQDPPSDMR